MRNPKSTTTKPDGARNKLLARLHILKQELRLDDDTYRDSVLEANFGVRSAAELDLHQLRELARSLERSAGQSRRRRPYPGRPRNMGAMAPRPARQEAAGESGRAAQLQKIEAMLTEAGRPWSYADALARRICQADRIAWVANSDLYKIIAALTKDAKRHGRRVK